MSHVIEIMKSKTFQNNFVLRKSKIANFVDIIKADTVFIKTTIRLKKKLKNRNYPEIIKMQSISVFLDTTVADFH